VISIFISAVPPFSLCDLNTFQFFLGPSYTPRPRPS